METPDILNSKIKKIRVELPHYSFSHSSSGDSSHDFIGRERIKEKLKQVIEDSPDEPGVYLIAGNRGVGKTSYVNEIVKKTSLQPKSDFTENLRYVIILFLAVAGTQSYLQEFSRFANKIQIIWPILLGLSLITLCFFNSHRHKFTKQKHGIFRRILNCVKSISDGIVSAFEELSFLINPCNPYGKTQYVLKVIFVICGTQFLSIISCFTPTIILFVYLAIVFLCIYIRSIIKKLQEYKNKNISKINIIFRIALHDSILNPIRNYIKNHNRLYLRINFGHKLKDERDILRLIARTLRTEYQRYHHSFRRMLPRRVMTFAILFLFAYLFSPVIERQEFYKSLIKGKKLYKYSSQILFDFPFLEDRERLEGAFSKEDTLVLTKVEETVNSDDEIQKKRNTKKPESYSKIGNVGSNFLLVLDQLVYETTKIVKNVPQYLLEGKIEFSKCFFRPINYLFWLSFFLMYLFYNLLFRCTWITHFFVTHQIITRRLKKLNSDITHSTELEKSIGVNSEKIGHGIGIKTKKSRDIADAREIEKELQDILQDMRRIPVLMCRPNVVIVFDELDKVEPGDASLENEITQTKASMFSIGATRERQTEILRILSNMKYFLSIARAKFIFIAGREMFDIHLADVSERNNYIGSIFNVVILVPSLLTDHHTGKKTLPQESSIASLPEEFVCRKLIPYDYPVESYDLKNYRIYLEDVIYKSLQNEAKREEIVQKIIAVLQQFIIYLAHLSKGAPKKMTQLFESFIEIRNDRDKIRDDDFLVVQRYHGSRHFLSFNYYKQYTLGIVAYLITPIFYRLAESNIKEHSDKLLVSSLRFVDFLFKFHKYSFSWKILDISPEMLEVDRAPELKSVAVELLNYLTQIHISKSNFSLYDYKFDSWIANEIFAMAKTDDLFSALFSFSLDEMLPLKKHYLDLLEKTENEYRHDKDDKTSVIYIDAVSSLQIVLGDLCYYNDELEEAGVYYKNAVEMIRKNNKINSDRLYLYVRNKLKLGMIHEKRKQYDFAYWTYGELCKQIIQERNDVKTVSRSPDLEDISFFCYDMSFEKMTYEGLKMLYLPFIAKLQILEKSHVGGITLNHLEQLDKEFIFLTSVIKHKETNLLEAEFYSCVADILYYKNSNLKYFNLNNDVINSSCTACDYYHEALYILLGKPDLNKPDKKDKNSIIKLLIASIERLKDNYNMKYCTILARILSNWGNVFFSCDTKSKKDKSECYIFDGEDCNTRKKCFHCACYICDIDDCEINNLESILNKYMIYVDSESKEGNRDALLKHFLNIINSKQNVTKMEIAFAMYAISLHAYRKSSLYKYSSYQIYKMLCLFKHYKIYKSKKLNDYIKRLSEQAIHYLWYANDDLNVIELNKRKKDFDKEPIDKTIPLQNLLVDSEITKIRILVKELELKFELAKTPKIPKDLTKYYDIRITSPYRINYSIGARIYRLWLKSKVNYEVYEMLLKNSGTGGKIQSEIEFILEDNDCNKTAKEIFGDYFNFGITPDDEKRAKIEILENLIAETIYCLIDIAQLTETMEETYVFTHSFFGSIHKKLSFWIRLYETYERDFYKKYKDVSRIKEYLEKYLDEEWREQLSGYRENQRALSHYYKCLEMHNEGRAYHNMIDSMCYVKDDFNDRSDHFNIAEERHLIVNGKIEDKINAIKNLYKESELYKADNYFGSS